MASLDRLATRQRILEQNGGLGTLPDKNGTNGTETNGSITHSVRILHQKSEEICVIQYDIEILCEIMLIHFILHLHAVIFSLIFWNDF